MRICLFIILSWISLQSIAQTSLLQGTVQGMDSLVQGVQVDIPKHNRTEISDTSGRFSFGQIPYGSFDMVLTAKGYKTKRQRIIVKESITHLTITLTSMQQNLEEVTIVTWRDKSTVGRKDDVEGTTITAGKKNEVIRMDNLSANTSINSTRQVFAQVPGINVIENDAGGVQMSLGTRGLNPNRITEFNSRQNGYDISADALGYPEAYYTPPVDALEKIEIIRGAASLQYGSQFGGLLNFVYKKGNRTKLIDGDVKQTCSQYGGFVTHVNAGGQYKRFNYFAMFNHRQGDSWRQNAGYNINTTFVTLELAAKKIYTATLDYTFMQYTAQQPGGLTDIQFAENPRQSVRKRNWFNAQWNILAQKNEFNISNNLKISWVNFAHFSHRYSVGALIAPNLPDDFKNRDLQKDHYFNLGSEARLLYTYSFLKQKNNLLVGIRFYRGETKRQQGLGTDGKDANFNYLHPDSLEGSSYVFPSYNVAVFAEHIFQFTKHFSITPGFRVEYLKTTAKGHYRENFVVINENKSKQRVFPLLGIGLSYKAHPAAELYANFSQNYSPINYNDIRVLNPNYKVDENIKDVKGYNADLGLRGKWNCLNYDVSFYYLSYNNRIGLINKADAQFNIYQYRTNIGNSATYGIEFFTEADLLKAANKTKFGHLYIYETFAYTHARYTKTQNFSIQNKKVELAPEWIVRPGIRYQFKGLDVSANFSYTSSQFTDAINSVRSADAITGLIPAYKILDARISYTYRWMMLTVGCDNLLNEKYFTRRASGYPGPGIVSAEARTVYASLKVHFAR